MLKIRVPGPTLECDTSARGQLPSDGPLTQACARIRLPDEALAVGVRAP